MLYCIGSVAQYGIADSAAGSTEQYHQWLAASLRLGQTRWSAIRKSVFFAPADS